MNLEFVTESERNIFICILIYLHMISVYSLSSLKLFGPDIFFFLLLFKKKKRTNEEWLALLRMDGCISVNI